MLNAFFDESGTDPKKNKALVLGGFLGKTEEWEKASDAWDECLRQKPAIGYFSHKEAQSLDGEFKRFNRTKADEKLLALAKVISQFSLRGVCASVPYRWFVGRDVKASKGIVGTRVYDWGFLAATSGVLQYSDEYDPGEEKVDFVFDERGELTACIRKFYEMKAHPFFESTMRRAGECSPGDDKKVCALQMADLISWEFSKAGEMQIVTEAYKLIACANHIVHIPCHPPRQLPNTLRLQKLAGQVRAEAGEFLRRSKKHSPDRFLSKEEIIKTLTDLYMHEAYFKLEWERHLLQQATDEEFVLFVKKYMASISPRSDDEERQ